MIPVIASIAKQSPGGYRMLKQYRGQPGLMVSAGDCFVTAFLAMTGIFL